MGIQKYIYYKLLFYFYNFHSLSSESSIMQPMPEMWTDAWVVRASDLTKALRGPGFEAVKGGRDVLQFF